VWKGKKSDGAAYRLILERVQAELTIPGWWRIDEDNHDGPRIVVKATRKPDDQPPVEEDWKDRLKWPALGSVGDAIRREVRIRNERWINNHGAMENTLRNQMGRSHSVCLASSPQPWCFQHLSTDGQDTVRERGTNGSQGREGTRTKQHSWMALTHDTGRR
jgi:hypothetical protein